MVIEVCAPPERGRGGFMKRPVKTGLFFYYYWKMHITPPCRVICWMTPNYSLYILYSSVIIALWREENLKTGRQE